MSGRMIVTYEGGMHAEARMTSPDQAVMVDAPSSCGGSGKSLSPIDLFAASYGSCVVMGMDLGARQNDFDISGAKVEVAVTAVKEGSIRIEAVDATVVLPQPLEQGQIEILKKSAHFCPVHNVLNGDVRKTLRFRTAQRRPGEASGPEGRCGRGAVAPGLRTARRQA